MSALTLTTATALSTATAATLAPAPKSCPKVDAAVSKYTAFDSLAEMISHMARGYVPTIYPKNKTLKALIGTLRGLGYRVYTGE